jgi:hypothetical protein
VRYPNAPNGDGGLKIIRPTICAHSALRRAAQRRQQIGWRGQAERLARPCSDGDQAEKCNDQCSEDCRGDYAVCKKRDDAAIFIGISGIVVVRAARVRGMRRMFLVAVNPLVSRGACRQHAEQQDKRDAHTRDEAG